MIDGGCDYPFFFNLGKYLKECNKLFETHKVFFLEVKDLSDSKGATLNNYKNLVVKYLVLIKCIGI